MLAVPGQLPGPARTAARVTKGDQVRFVVQYGTGPAEFTGRITRVWDKGATLAGRPRRMARIASGGKYYERNVDDLALIRTATVGPEVPPPPGFTKTRWELADDHAAADLVTLGFTDEAARRILDSADSAPRCAVLGHVGGLAVEVVRRSGGDDVTARPAWPEPSLSDLARKYMRAPGQVTLAEYRRLREAGMVTAVGQLRPDDAPAALRTARETGTWWRPGWPRGRLRTGPGTRLSAGIATGTAIRPYEPAPSIHAGASSRHARSAGWQHCGPG